MPTAPKKVINAWAMYDWANSAYNLVITSTIFPAYYVGITAATDPAQPSYVKFFWAHICQYGTTKLCVGGRVSARRHHIADT